MGYLVGGKDEKKMEKKTLEMMGRGSAIARRGRRRWREEDGYKREKK